MKPHLQCAEQQVSRSNLTKYCACHAERPTYLIIITYESSFTMRGATGVTIEPHRILRLSRRKTHMLNPHHISNTHLQCAEQQVSPSNLTKYWRLPHRIARVLDCPSHMKRHLQCAEQQVSPSNLTKYRACHTKWLACLIVVTYETSFPMRGATGITIQPHQILRLPRKMTLQDFKENLQKQVKRHFQCGAEPTLIRAWSEHDPSMIRPWSENENANRNPPRNRGYFSTSPRAFSIVKYNVSRPILHSNLQPSTAPATKSDAWTSPRTAPATKSVTKYCTCPRKVTLERHQVLHLPRKVTLELHQVLHLPRKVTLELHYSTLLDSTLLYLTLLDSTWLYLTLLDSTWFYLTLVDSISTRLYLTLLYSTWLYLTLLDSTWLYLTLLDSTWLYLTLLDSTWLYLILLDSTWLYLTLLYSTLLDSTWLYLTLTWLVCRSYIGSFSAKLPLMICKEGLCVLHKYIWLMWMVAYSKRFCLCHKGKTLALNQGFQSLGSPEFLPNWKEAWSLRWFHVTIWCNFCKQPWPFAALPVFVVATLGRPTAWFWWMMKSHNRLVLCFWWLIYASMFKKNIINLPSFMLMFHSYNFLFCFLIQQVGLTFSSKP